MSRIESSSGGRDAGVVEGDVDRAVGLLGGREERVDLVLVGDVDVDVRRDAARHRSCPTSSCPRWSSMSPMTTLAPSSVKRCTVARPIPEQPPVMTATLPSSRPAMSAPSLVADEDVLLLGERVGRVRAELAPEARLLEATERRPVAHRRVRVDAEVAGLDTARATRSALPTSRVKIEPDRPYSVSLASRTASSSSSNGITATTGPNTSSRHTRSCGVAREHHRRRHPEARQVGHRAGEGDLGVVDVAGDRLLLLRRDQRAHLRVGIAAGSATRIPFTAVSSRPRKSSYTDALDEQPRTGATVLAGVVEDGVRRRWPPPSPGRRRRRRCWRSCRRARASPASPARHSRP